MIEVRFHGRGGQGAVTSAELVALAAISEGKHAQSFPSLVVVLDPALIVVGGALSGLKEKGIIVINTRKSLADIKKEFSITHRTSVLDATAIARQILGLPITNTTMIGALVKATGVVKMESLIEPLHHRFGRIAEKNIKVCQKAFEETLVEE